MSNAASFVTVLIVGMMVGVEFGVAAFMNPVVDRLPDEERVRARAAAARLLGRVMPFWYVGSVAAAVIWALLGQDSTWAVLVAAALLMSSVLMSIGLLVPINKRVAQWSGSGVPSDWRAQL